MFLNRWAAFEFVKKLFSKNGLRISMVSYYNKQRHMLVQTSEGMFYVVFKKQPIHSFNHLREVQPFLKSHPDLVGWGESINVDCVDYANSRGVRVIFYVYEDEKVYYVPLVKVRNGVIREQKVGNSYTELQENGALVTQIVHEKEYVFPFKWLEKYE